MNFNLEEIKDLYYNKEYSIVDLAKKYNCNRKTISKFFKNNNLEKKKRNEEVLKQKRKQTNLKKYGVEYYSQTNNFKDKFKETCIKKYGTKNPLENEEIKNKIKETNLKKYKYEYPSQSKEIKEKVKNTCLEKYGVTCILQTKNIRDKVINKTNEEKENIINKRKQTCLEKYGVDVPMRNENIKNKIIQTNLEKYGYEYTFQNEEIKNKIKETMLKRYGVEYNTQRNEIKEKYREKAKQYWDLHRIHFDLDKVKQLIKEKKSSKYIANYYNCSKASFNNFLRKNNLHNYYSSSFEEEIYNYLLSIGINKEEIERNNRTIIKPLELDIYIKKYNIAIECNGFYYHNSSNEYKKPINYHLNKYKECEKKGIRLISIWDVDWFNEIKRKKIKKILNIALGKYSKKIYARKCEIKEIDFKTYKEFCNLYHLQNTRMASIKLGLYYNNELVEIMSFDKVRNNGKLNNKIEYEMIRNCIKEDYLILGGTKKLFNYFVKTYNPKSILSYSDNNFFTGNSYLKLGFKLKNYTGGDLFWVDLLSLEKLYRNPFKNKEYRELERNGLFYKCYGNGNKRFEFYIN